MLLLLLMLQMPSLLQVHAAPAFCQHHEQREQTKTCSQQKQLVKPDLNVYCVPLERIEESATAAAMHRGRSLGWKIVRYTESDEDKENKHSLTWTLIVHHVLKNNRTLAP